MRESKIETEVKKYAKAVGWSVYKFVSPGCRGVPDRIFLRNGIIIFVEFKATDKEPSKQQLKRKKELENQGFRVETIDNIDKGINIFKEV